MKVTIHHVAKLAGVSIKTVSRVLNNEAGVSNNTKEKVNAAIIDLNYQPNLSARNLAGRKSYVIAFVYDNPNAYYVIDMQQGILSACRDSGYNLLIYPCNANSPDIFEQLKNFITRSKPSGLILTPPLSENPRFLAQLNELEISYIRVIAGTQQTSTANLSLVINDRQGALQITQHLIEQGHSAIGFIAGDKQHHSTQERLSGFQQALTNAKLPIEQDYVIAGRYAFESGVSAAQTLLNLAKPPTAIVACNDEIAAGALFAARLKGIDVPEQLSIVGFENSPFSQQTWPKLSTVDLPTKDIAKQAANMLLSKLQNKPVQESEIIIPQVIIRDSSAPCSS